MILMKTATKSFPASSVVYDSATGQTFVSYYDIFTIGAGYLDIWAALNVQDSPSGIGPISDGGVRSGDEPDLFGRARVRTVRPRSGVTWPFGIGAIFAVRCLGLVIVC